LPTPYLSRLKLEKELEKKAQMLREKKEKCDALMSDVEKYMQILEGRIAIDDYKEQYKKGRELYDMKDMDAAIEVMKSLHSELLSKLKEVYKEDKEKIEKVMEMLSGEDLAKIRADLREGEEYLETSPEKSFEILDSISSRLKVIVEENIGHMKMELEGSLGSIEGFDWVKKEVAEVGDEPTTEALLKLREIRDRAVKKVEEKINMAVKRVNTIVEIAHSAHFNLPIDKSLENKISELMSEGNYAGALRVADEYLASAKKAFEFFYRKLYDIARRIVEEGKAMDIEIDSIMRMLEQSRKKYEEDNFEEAVALIKKSTEEAEKLKVQKVMDTMKKARDIFLQAKSQGIDIEPFLKRMDNARNFLKIGKPKRAYDIILETLDMVERKKNLYEQLKSEIKRIKEIVEDLRKENIVLEGVDESIAKIDAEIEKSPERAEKMVNELRAGIKSSLRDIAQTLYGDIEKLIDLGEKEGLVLEDMRLALRDIKGQITDESYRDAILELRKIEEELYSRTEAYLEDIEKRTSKFEDKDIKAKIEAVKKDLENAELEAAFEKLGEIRERIFEIESKGYIERIKKLRDEVEFLRGAGGNVTEILSYVERAEVALKKKDIVRVEDYISRSEETLKNVESLVAKETFDSAKAIAAAAKRIGVNISAQGILGLLKKAKESIEKGEYHRSIEYSLEAKKKSKELRDKAEHAYSLLVNAAKRVSRIKEMNGKVDELAKLLVEAKKSLEDNDFERVEKLSNECIQKADKIEKKTKIEQMRKEIDSIGKVMSELGLADIYKQKSREFYRKYEDMKYDELPPIGEKVLSELREYVETILTDYIGKIETDIYDAKGKGYNLDINMQDLENAADLFIKRKYMESLYLLKKLENQIAAIYERNERMEELKSEIKKYMDMAVSLGIDTTEYKRRLAELEQEKDLKVAQKKAKKIISDIEGALYKKVRALMVKVEKELDAMRRRGEDITAPENILNKAKDKLKDKKYVESLNLVMNAVGEIEKYEIQKNTAYGILKRLGDKIKVMQNVLPKKIVDEYEYSKKLFLKGLYEQSIERSMKVSEEISEIERILNYIKEKNKQIREMVMRAHHLGMDVRDVIRIFNKAKEEFKNMHYQESLKLVDQCYAEAKLLMIDAMNKYKGAYSRMLSMMKRMHIDDYFKDDIRQMEELFDKGDYDSIKVKLSEMNKALNQKLGELSNEMLKEFAEKKALFKSMHVDAGIDFDKEEMKLREYRAKDFNKFFEYYASLNEKIESYMPKIIRKKVEELKSEFDKYERYGANTEEYHSRLYEIISEMEEKDYNEIFKMLREVENKFRVYIDEYVKTLIERVKKRVSEFSEAKANEYVERMEKLRSVGNYIDAIRVYEEASNFVGRYKVFREDFGKKVEEVKDRLRFALSLGLKVGDLITKLKEIEEHAPEDMERANLELKDLKSEVNKMIDALEPRIEVDIELGEESGGVIKATLGVKNTGDVEAQNVQIHIRGALIADKPIEVLKVDKGAREEVEATLRIGKGNKVSIVAHYNRFDGKEYTYSQEFEVSVEKPKEETKEPKKEKHEEKEKSKEESKGYHIEKAKEKVKCSFCRGTILPAMNLDVVICDNCGAVYHVPCAKRIKKCKVCGQEFKFD